MKTNLFSTQVGQNQSTFNNLLEKTGLIAKKCTNKRRPETFLGDLQEVLKLAPRNVNAFFFSWSLTCRAATGLLCLLLL